MVVYLCLPIELLHPHYLKYSLLGLYDVSRYGSMIMRLVVEVARHHVGNISPANCLCDISFHGVWLISIYCIAITFSKLQGQRSSSKWRWSCPGHAKLSYSKWANHCKVLSFATLLTKRTIKSWSGSLSVFILTPEKSSINQSVVQLFYVTECCNSKKLLWEWKTLVACQAKPQHQDVGSWPINHAQS